MAMNNAILERNLQKNVVPAVYMISHLPFHMVKRFRVCPHCIGQCRVRAHPKLTRVWSRAGGLSYLVCLHASTEISL